MTEPRSRTDPAAPRAPRAPRALGALSLPVVAGLVGLVAGLGAAAFRALIGLFHNAFFEGRLSYQYDANVHTPPSPWGALVVLVPVVGSLGVTFLVQTFAPEAKGHGVPEVMDAVYYQRAVIRPVVGIVKSLASALSIGSGGAVGREGPIVQIGSSFASTLAQLLRLPLWQSITLIAAGAGGGIAATFNTPIGGVLFAVEIVLHEVSARTLVPVAISAATATYIGRLFFGAHPSFVIPAFELPYFEPMRPQLLACYVLVGLGLGLVSALYIRSIYAFEDFFDRRIRGPYTRHALGMLAVGLMMYGSQRAFGHYYIEGVGYAVIQDILASNLTQISVLLAIFAMKLVATGLTLGSGASGGVFSPALVIGATLGAAFGAACERLFPGLGASPAAFAVAGMAALVGGSTGAALAAIVMTFEMTLDYNVIVPITLTVSVAYGVRRAISRESIYTLKLARRGHHMPEALQTNFHLLIRARAVMEEHAGDVSPTTTLDEAVQIADAHAGGRWLVSGGDGGPTEVISRDALLSARSAQGGAASIGDLPPSGAVRLSPDDTLFDVMARLRATGAAAAVVVEKVGGRAVVKGVIDRCRIGEVLTHSIELYADA